MKIRILKLTCVLGGLMGLASAGFGQTTVSKVHVPFSFVASGKTLPAGDYSISDTTMSRILVIQDNSGNSAEIMTASVANGIDTQKPRLTFERHGEELVLTGIQTSDVSVRLSLPAQRVTARASL